MNNFQSLQLFREIINAIAEVTLIRFCLTLRIIAHVFLKIL